MEVMRSLDLDAYICVPMNHPDVWEPLQIEEIWGILTKGLSCEKGSQCG